MPDRRILDIEVDRSLDSDVSRGTQRGTRQWISLSDTGNAEIFLRIYGDTGNFAAACREIGCSRAAAYTFRKNHPDFADKCAEAEAKYAAHVHSEIRRRGIEGVEQPVFHQGAIVGHVLKYSDRLLEMEARRVMPEYREAMAGSGGSKITNNIAVNATAQAAASGAASQNPLALDPSKMTKAQREAYRAFLATMGPDSLPQAENSVHELAGASPQAEEPIDAESSEAIQVRSQGNFDGNSSDE